MNVPQLRFSGFEEEWKEYTSKDIFNVITDYVANGSFASLKENVTYKNEKDFAVLIRLQDYSNQFKGPFVYVNKKSYNFLSKTSLNAGDIVISNVGANAGRVFQVPNLRSPMTLGPNSILVKTETMNNNFLYFLLSSFEGQKSIKNVIGISAQPKFNKTDFKTITFNLPMVKEQEKIANFISLIDFKIIKQKEKLKKIEQLNKGMMQKIFSQELRFKDKDGGEFTEWETKSLIELGEFKRSYSFSRSYEGEGKYYHIHYGDIHTKLSSIVDNGTELPKINVNEELEKLEEGDILFADASEDYKDLGKTVVITSSENKKIVAGLHTHRFQPSTLINPVYLMYFTKTNYYSSFIRMYGTGVSVLGISKNNLGTLEVPLPSKEEQIKIADFLMKIDSKIEKEKEKLIVLEEQKRGFMHGMFV